MLTEKGGIPWHDFWRLEYFRNPYLLLVAEPELRQRFFDVNANMEEFDEEGRIGPDRRLIEKRDGTLFCAFTQFIEEYQARHGGMTSDLSVEGRARMERYFGSGEMRGVSMFRGRPLQIRGSIVKFTKQQFAADMLKHGAILLSPASYYSSGGLLKSMRDFETIREFRIPAIDLALKGKKFASHNGETLMIEGGAANWKRTTSDYYLYSTCLELDRRMPSDFDADAAVIIKDKRRFVHAFRKAFKKHFGQSDVFANSISYYDPFQPSPKVPLEFMKHFAYAYQREHRVVARPFNGVSGDERVILKLGAMDDYTELIT